MISYLADIYTGKTATCDSPAKLLLYFSFFPQIIQGPIPRYHELYPQLISQKEYDSKNTDLGIMRILYGFFLKLMIADKAKIIVDNIFANWEDYGGSIYWIAAILYSIELYTDFRACVEISKGVGCIFGIKISSNFHKPYLSTSIKEFWRRWHITLSQWLRDYIYFPLGGNRRGRVRKYGNILIVFVLSGFWHGGGMKFLLWGLMHGIYQIIEDVLGTDRYKNRVYTVWRVIFTFVLVTIAWVIFRADNVKQGIVMILYMITFHSNADVAFNFWDLGLSVKQWGILIFAILVLTGTENERLKNWIACNVLNANAIYKGILYVAVGIVLTIFGTYGYGYNAQDFIYGGF